jgi:acylphosphatase
LKKPPATDKAFETPPRESTALHIIVFGHVQGVGFRAWTATVARKMGITGWVRNCDDGSVEIIAEGQTNVLKSFLETVQKGNTYSDISGCTVNPVKARFYSHFSIETA